MPNPRRQFLAQMSLGFLGAAVSLNADAEPQEPSQLPPGAPSAFGTGPAVGPEVTTTTLAEAEKLARVEFTPAERTQAANLDLTGARLSSCRFAESSLYGLRAAEAVLLKCAFADARPGDAAL